MGQSGLGAAQFLEGWLRGAFHTSAHTTQLPGVLPNHSQSWSELFKEKQDETARPEETMLPQLLVF